MELHETLQLKVSALTEAEQMALNAILDALEYAKKKHPDPWDPRDVATGKVDYIHAAAIVNEEAGELIRDAVSYKETISSPLQLNKMLKEAAQTGCTTIRFLANTITPETKFFVR